ncbi:c-type cytochrome [Pseudomonadales bacterium]|nr:c-type cytochrome [Pseudomonadales bacterium]
MLRILLGIMVLLGSSGLLADGNAANGQDLVVVCGACHGQDGNSPAGAFPSLAGQGEKYLYKQMVDIKDGRRSAITMTGLLDGYSDQQIMDIAAYYASQQTKVGAASADLVALGEKVYRAGVARKNIAACTACHSPNGRGNRAAAFPALSGQWPEYTSAQLKAFRSGERNNDGESRMMRLTAMDLSDKEIEAVSSYLYGLK